MPIRLRNRSVRIVYLLAALAPPVSAADRPLDFGRDIQPILAENCFQCHGPDASQRKAALRLDSFEAATAGHAIVPGKSGESEAIRRVFCDDPAESMPPPKSNRKLSDTQKHLLKRWVDSGANYTRHWAFVRPVQPAIPNVPPTARVKNPIDAFVADKLAKEGLPQAPESDKAGLLRRVTLDLIGLPPTLEELDGFLADTSPEAYEKVVERLLASPRFGERMVWEWLDAARYADTNGYQGDPTRPMWPWRDWAIGAINSNMPFDRFTIEQLAGDLLPNPDRAQLIATGFHRNHMINGEGGRIPEESRVEYVQDRVETTGMVWMGLTLTCCRCHDHKYDPFTQRDYYQLAAYFNSIDESGANDAGGLANPVITLASPELEKRIDDLEAREQTAEAERAQVEQNVRSEQPAWERGLVGGDGKVRQADWRSLIPMKLAAEQATTLQTLDDGSIRSGENPSSDDYQLTFEPSTGPFTMFKLEALSDEAFPSNGPGRADNGNFVLSELTLKLDENAVELTPISADFAQQGWPYNAAFDGDQATGWAVAPELGKAHVLLFAPKAPLLLGQGQKLAFRLSFRFGSQHTLGRFRLSATGDDAELLRPLPAAVVAAFAKPQDQRSDADQAQLTRHFLDTHLRHAAAKRKRDELRQARESAEREALRTMVLRERAQPRETFVLDKGAYNAPREKVERGVLASLAPLPANLPENRLALAQWLVSAEHPLTARVTVNRIWQQFFGVGLVKSAEDFGIQGDRPSHPELLDWLAVEFGAVPSTKVQSVHAWDVKHLVHLIVTSATYRQSSRVTPGMAERDPENRLLFRGPRFRLPSWMLRDQALAVSGLLVERSGGPPARGYQPPGVWEDATFGQIRYEQDKGEALYRRSLYTFWRRIVAPTVFFDVANRQNCTVRVGRTNTPLHALATLNDVTYVEASRALAQRTLLSADRAADASRIVEMFRRCTARPPTPRELDRLTTRLDWLRAAYLHEPSAAKKLVSVGESIPDEGLPAEELAAWTSLASLILNLDETLTKE